MAAPTPKTGKGGAPYTAAVQHAIANRNLYLLPFGSPDSDLEASCKLSSDTYLDLNTNLDIDIKPGTSINLDYSPYIEFNAESNVKSNAELDSEAKEILEDITQLGKKGPTKPNHTPHTQKLWKREGEFQKG